MPGEDFADSMHIVLGEVGELPHLVELPARGAGAAMVGRTLSLITGMGVDLQPAGWRLTDASGLDHRRAASLLAQDLDTLEELMQGHRGSVKLQITGPLTLAAAVERPRGDKVLADHGGRRDLAQALAEGLDAHLSDVRRRLGGVDLVVQVDEPALPAVLSGSIPTASGFSRHRSVTAADAAQALGWACDAIVGAEAEPVLHCCSAGVPWAVLRQTPLQAVSFDLSLLASEQYDDVAAWVDTGRQVWLGVIPALDQAGQPPSDADVTRRVQGWWSNLGFSDPEMLPPTVVTPTCGLAGASPTWARQALGLAQSVAQNLSEQNGKMGS
ncbi:MAG: methionine synthase [Nocardioidaceae bacterium]|nr:methionine synthase [Nocardioidaceae bacterium]